MKTTENQRVKLVRESLLLTQPQFAKCLDSSVSAIAKIEGGAVEVTPKFLNKISQTFNINPSWIKTGEGKSFMSGTLEENITRVNTLLGSNHGTINPWENALVKELKEEVTYLRELLRMAVGGKSASANFKKASDLAGFPFNLLKGDFSGASAQA